MLDAGMPSRVLSGEACFQGCFSGSNAAWSLKLPKHVCNRDFIVRVIQTANASGSIAVAIIIDITINVAA